MIRVWAVGDLGGGIAADRNVGDFTSPFHPVCGIYSTDYTLFSYGDMSPTVRATNTASLPTGGHVGCVGALGDITGDFEAVAELVGFRAGGDITATITAPVVGPILANDSTMASDFPVPATPASAIAEILAEAAALYAELVDAKTTTAAEIASLLADFGTEKAAALTKLADNVAAVVQSNAVIRGSRAKRTRISSKPKPNSANRYEPKSKPRLKSSPRSSKTR